jgi:hypothetical protein
MDVTTRLIDATALSFKWQSPWLKKPFETIALVSRD